MPSNYQACFFEKLKEEFLAGLAGDFHLKFVHEGEIVDSRKCDGYVLRQIDYFAAQKDFEEGITKTYTVDISQFYLGCQMTN